MKITVDAKEFLAALKRAVVEKKTTIPVLTTIKLSTEGRIISTDLDQWTVEYIRTRTRDRNVEETLIPAKMAMDILAGESGDVLIHATPTTLATKRKPEVRGKTAITVGGCEYSFDPMMALANFPSMPEVTGSSMAVSGAELLKMIRYTQFAISSEQTRYVLQAALLEPDGKTVRMTATDGNRLSTIVASSVSGKPFAVLLSRAALNWLAKHIDGETVKLTLDKDHGYVSIEAGSATLISRVVTGKFPYWRAVMPAAEVTTTTATIPSAAAFAKTLARVAKCSDERGGCVTADLNGALTLSASSERGKATANVAAKVEGKAWKFGLNSTYLSEFLKLAQDSAVTISVKDGASGVLFTSAAEPSWNYLLMPMRI